MLNSVRAWHHVCVAGAIMPVDFAGNREEVVTMEKTENLFKVLACKRTYGNGDTDCSDAPSEWSGENRENYCVACRATIEYAGVLKSYQDKIVGLSKVATSEVEKLRDLARELDTLRSRAQTIATAICACTSR